MPRVSRPTVYADVGAIATPFFFLFDAPVSETLDRQHFAKHRVELGDLHGSFTHGCNGRGSGALASPTGNEIQQWF